MTEDHRRLLGFALTGLAEVFNAPLSAARIAGYCEALDDLPHAAIVAAIKRAKRESERFPTPQQLRRLTRPDGPARPLAHEPRRLEEPIVTRPQMAAILRDVTTRDLHGEYTRGGARSKKSQCEGRGRVAWMARMADAMERGEQARPTGNVFADTFARIAAGREPGDDG